MKNLLLPLAIALASQGILYAQTINMELADPQPFLQGGDTGDMEFADLDGDGDADVQVEHGGEGQIEAVDADLDCQLGGGD